MAATPYSNDHNIGTCSSISCCISLKGDFGFTLPAPQDGSIRCSPAGGSTAGTSYQLYNARTICLVVAINQSLAEGAGLSAAGWTSST
jgi:hypothetical protein